MDWLKNKLFNLVQDPDQTDSERIEYENDFLRKISYDDVDFFHLRGYECWAKIVKIYDGDTCTAVLFLNGKPMKFRVRLAGIDTAEKKSEDAMEIDWANKAIDRLNELIGDGLIYLKCHRWDKYGRLLGSLYHDDQSDEMSFNQILLNEDLAYEYHGGTRKGFRDWHPGNLS